MSFFAFQLYLFITFLRPVELFAQWLVPYRPVLILWVFAFLGAVIQVFRQRKVAARGVSYWLLTFFTVGIAMSMVFAGWASGAIGAVSDFSACALLFVLISFNLVSIERLRAACYVILLSMGILCAMGINAFHTGFMSEELVLQQRKDDDVIGELAEKPAVPADDKSGIYMWRVRGVGYFNDPNDFAQAIVMTMPMLWWFYRKGRWFKNLFFVGLPAAMMGYTVFLTNSRGALLGMASLMFFGVRSVLGTTRTAIAMAVMGGGAMLANMTGGRGFSSQEESAGQRIEAWYEGFMMFKSSPLFGVGYNSFIEHHYLTAHNSFVLCFAELGMFGYLTWIGLLVIGYKSVSMAADLAPVGSLERSAGVLLRSSLIGYLTCAWFLSRTYQPTLYALLALCSAALFCAQNHEAVPADSPLKKRIPWFFTTILMVVLSMVFIYLFILMHNLKG